MAKKSVKYLDEAVKIYLDFYDRDHLPGTVCPENYSSDHATFIKEVAAIIEDVEADFEDDWESIADHGRQVGERLWHETRELLLERMSDEQD